MALSATGWPGMKDSAQKPRGKSPKPIKRSALCGIGAKEWRLDWPVTMQEWSRHTGIPWIDWAGWGNRGLAAPSLGSSPHIQSYQLAKMAEVTDSCNLGSAPAHRHPCCASELTLLAHVFHLLPPPKCPTKEMLHPQGIRLAWLLIFTFKFPCREKRNLTHSHLPAWVVRRNSLMCWGNPVPWKSHLPPPRTVPSTQPAPCTHLLVLSCGVPWGRAMANNYSFLFF